MQDNSREANTVRRHRRMHTQPLHEPKKRKSLFEIRKKSKYWDIEASRRVGDEISQHVYHNRRRIVIDLHSPVNYRLVGTLLPLQDENTEEQQPEYTNFVEQHDPMLKKLSHDLSLIGNKKSKFGRLLHQIKTPVILPPIHTSKSFVSQNYEQKARKQRLEKMSDFKRQFYFRQRQLLNQQPPLIFLKNELQKKFDQILSDIRE